MNPKLLLLLLALPMFGCAPTTKKPSASISIRSAPLVNSSSLRTTERLREYRFGRYVDPGDPLVMHESHPVYRVETTASWNLQPGANVLPQPRPAAASSSVFQNDAVVAEVNKQRTATRLITEQTATLNQRLAEMTKAAGQTQALAAQELTLQRELAALREQVNTLQSRPQNPASTPSSSPPSEVPW